MFILIALLLMLLPQPVGVAAAMLQISCLQPGKDLTPKKFLWYPTGFT